MLSFLFIHDPQWLLVSMLGVGFAWASILSLPYAIVSDSVPSKTMGVYMGIFNFFIVIPQLVAASVLGFFLKTVFRRRAMKFPPPVFALASAASASSFRGFCAAPAASEGGAILRSDQAGV